MIKKRIFLGIIFLLLASFNKAISQDIVSDLVLEMSFSNEVSDLTGNAVPISIMVDEIYVEDRFGNPNCAIQFNGLSSEFVEIPVVAETELVNGGEEFTISLWFRMGNVENGDFEILFQKDTTGLYFRKPGEFGMYVYDLNTPLIDEDVSDAPVSNSVWDNDWNSDSDLHTDTLEWHHLVMVVDDTVASLYRDGEFRGDNSGFYDGPFNIGDGLSNYYLGRYFKGYMDDLKLYQRALNLSEISMLYELEGNCEAIGVGLPDQTNQDNLTIIQKDQIVSVMNMTNGSKTIEIYNQMGQRIMTFDGITDENESIDFSHLPKGLYIVAVTNHDTNSFISEKIILN